LDVSDETHQAVEKRTSALVRYTGVRKVRLIPLNCLQAGVRDRAPPCICAVLNSLNRETFSMAF
jgi:hypothetical protein